MVIVMQKHTDDANIERVTAELVRRGFDVHRSTGSDQTILGVVGKVDTIDTREFELFEGVQEVVRVSEPYKLSSRTFRPVPSSQATRQIGVGRSPGGTENSKSTSQTSVKFAWPMIIRFCLAVFG